MPVHKGGCSATAAQCFQCSGTPVCRISILPSAKTAPLQIGQGFARKKKKPIVRTDGHTDRHGLCLGRLGRGQLFVWGAVAFGAAAAAGGGGRQKGGPFGGFQGGSDQGGPPPQWQGC